MRPRLYVSQPQRWGRDAYIVAEGTSPYNAFVFREPKELHELAVWHMGLEVKYQRWPWWRISPPPRITGLRFIEIRPIDRLLGWVLTAVAIYESVRRTR